ncbi:hypothetical protein O6H91_20G064600 [Diphasiastrum complanatum]|nr:hypothetical protein O6H91_20G064600 [Diphasiastrum complanatum]
MYSTLNGVSRSWRRALSSEQLFRTRHELGCTEPWIYCLFCSHEGPSKHVTSLIEAYDPVHNLWLPVGRMPGLANSEMLKGYGSVGLNGKLYIVGGRICSKGSSSEVEKDLRISKDVYAYDCITGAWKQCTSMLIPRVDFACSVCDGNIIIAGGRDTINQEKGVATAEMYIPEKDGWISLEKMSAGRYKCVGLTVSNKIYVIGGFTSSDDDGQTSPRALAWNRCSVEIYDPAKGKWEFVKGMWQIDIPPYQVVNLEGQLYSCGDLMNSWKGSIDIYDGFSNMWKTVRGSRRRLREDLACKEGLILLRRYVTMAAIGRQLYFLAGYCQSTSYGSSICLDTVDIFDISGDESIEKWKSLKPIPRPCREICSPCCVVDA